jgi:YYY domain-containing protein
MALLLGLVALPLAFRVFPHLPDRGYAFGKALGLLLVSYLLWLAGLARVLPNTRGSIAIILATLALLALFLFLRRRREMALYLSQNRRVIIITEVLFLLAFLLWAGVRAQSPEIAGTEKPMDFAFLNSILRASYFPPPDPWFSGQTISYYYFGYLMMAVMTKATGVAAGIGFNLAVALLFALTATGAFCLVYDLVRAARGGGRAAIGFGLVAVAFLLLLGNLEAVLEVAFARGLGSEGFWGWVGIKGLAQPSDMGHLFPSGNWWWRATRVIDTLAEGRSLDYTITEFPLFSFLLGDLHPHLMGLSFALLALGLSLNILLTRGSLGLIWLKKNPLQFGVILLALGSLGFINTWDLPTYTAIFGAALALQIFWNRGRLGEGIILVVALLVGIFLLYLPFYLGLKAQVMGIWPWFGPGTCVLHYGIIWGLFLFIGLSFLFAVAYRALRGRFGGREMAASALLVLLPLVLWSLARLTVSAFTGGWGEGLGLILDKFWHLLPLLAVLTLALALIFRMVQRGSEEEGSTLFALTVIFFGLFLTLGGELFYLRDLFGNRMNTIFKFYNQAWVLLAMGSAFGLYYIGRSWRSRVRLLVWGWWGLLGLLLLGALIYPVARAGSLAQGTRNPTLDGLAFLSRVAPWEKEAIDFLQGVPGSPVIVEAVGPDYTQYGRVSAYTGLPAVLGQMMHEQQWRGSAYLSRRRDDVARVYQSRDMGEVRALLDKYRVTYVYVGPRERMTYGVGIAQRFDAFMDVAFRNEKVTIYKVR